MRKIIIDLETGQHSQRNFMVSGTPSFTYTETYPGELTRQLLDFAMSLCKTEFLFELEYVLFDIHPWATKVMVGAMPDHDCTHGKQVFSAKQHMRLAIRFTLLRSVPPEQAYELAMLGHKLRKEMFFSGESLQMHRIDTQVRLILSGYGPTTL